MPEVVYEDEEIKLLPDNLHLRSEEVQDFISNKPNFIVRWGISFFFFVFAMLGVVCWHVQYPDVVVTKAKLNSLNSPKEVVTKTDGKLQTILVKDGDWVTVEKKLVYMESIAAPQSVYTAKAQIDSIYYFISENKSNEIVRFFPDYTKQGYLKELGELQQQFQTFIQAFIAYRDFISNGFYLRKNIMLQTDMKNIERLHAILFQQKELLINDLSLSKETFDANESLAKDKVISPLDFRNEKSKLISKQLSLPQVNSAIINNESQQNEKRKEIAELENQIVVQKNNFVQALQTFGSQIEQWEYRYVLKAPVSGKLSFSGFFQQDQFIKNGQLLFYVQPTNTSYFVEILVPQYNFGKVKEGQDVLLKFLAYPYEQFGFVSGKIEFISTAPTDSGFLAKVSLPDGLVTNHKKQLQYQYGLFAQAEIITENMRLLERFYYNIKKQISRK